MNLSRHITTDLISIGSYDLHQALFENIYPIPQGMTYNSYLLLDQKTVLMDTCDESVKQSFLTNLKETLKERSLDYIFVHHMEPDHCSALKDVLTMYPMAKIVCTSKAQILMKQFLGIDSSDRFILIKDGEELVTGSHHFKFLTAPMVHWPEVMVSYDETDKMLFSADAFGSFGALNHHLYADEIDIEHDWLDEGRRYYANIVGKFGSSVQMLLKKASGLDIQMICPLHGPIWRQNIQWLLNKYNLWSLYQPEEEGILIVCGSVYGHTMQAMQLLVKKLFERGVVNVLLYDASRVDVSYLVGKAFQYSNLVIASATYNNGIFPPIEQFLLDLKAHSFQNRDITLVQNGSWAPASGRLMKALCEEMKNIRLRENILTLLSALSGDQEHELDELADELCLKCRE